VKISRLDHSTLQQVLSANLFEIPRFQRPFSWDSGNVDDFWLDCILEGGTEYFIGSTVVYPSSRGPLSIVDGQQRLTTATLILCALREAFASHGLTDQASGIQEFVERKDVDNKAVFVLDTETSKPFLQEYIQKDSPPDLEPDNSEEIRALDNAYKRLNTKIADEIEAVEAASKGLTPKKRIAAVRKRLSELRDQLLSLKMIVVEVADEEDAYIVFETLNARGKDLELADMVKNHLFKLIGTAKKNVDPARITWSNIREEFDQSSARINVNTFLHHSWLSRNPYVAENKVFSEMRKEIRKPDAKDFLQTLRAESVTYRSIKEPSSRTWTKEQRPIARSLTALAQFGISQPLPLVLSILRAFDDGKISRKQCVAALWTIEAFQFSHTVVAQKSSSGGMSYLYARFAREIANEKTKSKRDNLLRDMRNELLARRPSRAEFIEGFMRFRYSKEFSGDRGTVRYILDRQYRKLSGHTTTDFSAMTIEHLGSQSGTKLQPESIASIGNLVYVGEALQLKLGNKRFAAKQEILKEQDEAWIPAEVLDAKKWGKVAIASRAEAMADTSYDKVWVY